jgi:hypothetical protein
VTLGLLAGEALRIPFCNHHTTHARLEGVAYAKYDSIKSQQQRYIPVNVHIGPELSALNMH